MNQEQNSVKEFHEAFGLTVEPVPTYNEEEARVSYELIREETAELLTAVDEQDMVEIADALADLLYVVYGAGLRLGIDLEFVFDEVHRSNMTKVNGHRREDGKWIKPDDYSPADISNELELQGWTGTKQPTMTFGPDSFEEVRGES